ncbi:MAG: hypothetical protein ACK58N_15570 [Synechocystis sp.]|jgi:hypothetical protein
MEEAFWFIEHADFWYPPHPSLAGTPFPRQDITPRSLSLWETIANCITPSKGMAITTHQSPPISAIAVSHKTLDQSSPL